jgi:hypothetical protein
MHVGLRLILVVREGREHLMVIPGRRRIALDQVDPALRALLLEERVLGQADGTVHAK